MGSVGDCFDNSVAEAFFSGLQRELLDQHHWTTRAQLATAIFEWIECWYNPHRRHSYCHGFSPIDYETATAAWSPQAPLRGPAEGSGAADSACDWKLSWMRSRSARLASSTVIMRLVAV